ncbi:MAG: hypothetical protein KIC94_12765 [Clostridiales bacterium]|nr:hypothetical protein [Clostridiales bacterium]
MISKETVKYVVCGIQFNHSFRLLDNWGEIADQLLYKSKYFNVEIFDNISTQYTTDRTLTNSVTGDYLKLTPNQLIYRMSIKKNFEEEYKKFKDQVSEYLIPEIITNYNLISRRMGLVLCEEIDKEGLMKFTDKYFKPEIKGISSFRFSKKEAAKESLLWKGSSNSINKIFTVGDVCDEFETGITYDFQLYLEPLQADLRNRSITFFDEAIKNFRKDVTEVL